MEENDIQQFLLVRHIVSSETICRLDLTATPVPSLFRMDVAKLHSILPSLVVVLSRFDSPFQDHIGVECLNMLTEKQFEALWPTSNDSNRFWLHRRRLFIHGQPGTGKTVIAIEIAKQLARTYGQENVLYICRHVPIRDYLR